MFFRLYLLIAIASLLFFKPISFIVGCYRRKRKLLKYVEHLQSPKEYPLVGIGNRFFWKNNEGEQKKIQMDMELRQKFFLTHLENRSESYEIKVRHFLLQIIQLYA